MIDDETSVIRIGIQRVRIIAEPRDRNFVDAHQIAKIVGFFLREIRNVDVANARISAIRSAWRPAHQFDASEPFLGGESQDFFQRKIAENRTDETELHDKSPTRRSFYLTRRIGMVDIIDTKRHS